MKLPNKKYLILTLIALVLFSGVIFLIYMAISDIQKASQQILAYKEQVATIDQETRELEDFKKRFEDYKPNLERIDRLFFDKANPVEFIRFLEKTARDSSVEARISLVPYQSEAAESVYFQISAIGEFLHLLTFSEKIENGPYLIRLNSISLQRANQTLSEGKNQLIQANMLIEVMGK